MEIAVVVADASHVGHAEAICLMMAEAAKKRGTGIAKRSPVYIAEKMTEGKGIIALSDGKPVGFCYIESWEHDRFVANSGLIVHEDFRKTGLAKRIKARILELSGEKFPGARVFGITTSLAVMRINTELGYKPVTFSELTDDDAFWKGCNGCVNVDILQRTNRKLCLCTGMLYEPVKSSIQQTQEIQHEKV